MKINQKESPLLEETLQMLDQRNAELAVINSVQDGLAKELDIQGIYDMVGDKVQTLFNAQAVIISTFDSTYTTEFFNYTFENGEKVKLEPRPVSKLRQLLIDKKHTIYIATEEQAKNEFGLSAIGETKMPKSLLFVPLIAGNIIRGYVSLQNMDTENAFSDSDIRLLETLANSMSVALENARLFDVTNRLLNETELRNAELAVINSVQEGLVAEMDMQGIYDLVGDKITNLFDAQASIISIFNHEAKTEDFKYVFEKGERVYPKPRPYDKIRQRLINTKKLIDIEENSEEAYTTITGETPKAVPGTGFSKSMLFVPLIIGNDVRGYVSLQNIDKEHAFSNSDVRLLGTLANSMSVALENARLFSETEQRNAELAVINSVQEGLVAEMNMQGIYDLVGEKIRNLFDAQVTAIAIFNHETKTEYFHYAFENGERVYPKIRTYDKIRERLINTQMLIDIEEKSAEVFTEITGEAPKSVPGTSFAKSMIFVPLIIGNDVRGYVSLQNNDREHAFSESDVRLLSTLANSMSVALENARLFNETEQRNAELAVINSVQEGLVAEMDMQNIYNLVGEKICEVLNTQTLIIRTFDQENEIETWEFAIENGTRLYSDPRPLIWANKHLIRSKEPLLINENYTETSKKFGGTGVTKGLPPKSAIFVPMLLGGKIQGSISLQNVEHENAFTESDVRLLNTLTNSMSVALENARLFNETTRLLAETEQRATEMQTVNNISRALVSQLEFDALMNLVGEQMRETFKADIVYLAIHDSKSNMLNFPYYYGEYLESRQFGNGITEKIILNKEPLLINQDLDKASTEIKAEIKGEMVESYLGVPIFSGGKSIGVISVQSKEQKNRFNDNDLRLLTTIASNLGVAMQNAEAYQKLQAALTELKSTQTQLIQSEKMASLGELTAGIAHEIQNPLNFVNNFSEVNKELLQELKEEADKGNIDEVKSIANDVIGNEEKINHHGRRADAIVKGMLQHSRSTSGKKEPTDINALCDEYLRLSYHGLRAKDKSFNSTMKTDFDEAVGKINVIPQDIGRVILNLLTNAFYAVDEKLKAHSSQLTANFQPTVSVTTKKSDNHVIITVSDNGNGISQKLVDKIFQPFFTTKPTGQGTGLGLSLSYDIIKAHGGELKVETKEGEGSEFIIFLPV
jgi:GAF domain-containing protein